MEALPSLANNCIFPKWKVDWKNIDENNKYYTQEYTKLLPYHDLLKFTLLSKINKF